MGIRVVAVLLLVALVGGSQADGDPEDLSFIMSMVEPLIDCKFGELSCAPGCLSVRICLGGSVYGEVEACDANNMCEPTNATCVADLKVCHLPDPTKFICVDPKDGRFPNPYDCHKYFDCAAGTATPGSCEPVNNGYDPLTGMCIFLSNHRVCKEGPVPTCKASMQSGALVENPNMYYVCAIIGEVLQPLLLRCDKDTQIYQDGQCVEAGESTTVQTTTAAVTTTSPDVTTTSAAATTTSPEATTTSAAATTTSPEATTTSAAATTTSPEATTTSAAATTTSPEVTTTTQPATTTKYYCTTPGTTVPDPLDCRGYYLCTMDMEQIHFTCQQGYHYDKSLRRCVKGPC